MTLVMNLKELNTLCHINGSTFAISDGDKVTRIDLSNYTIETENTNILTGEQYVPHTLYDGYVNKVLFNNNLYLIGNNSIFGKISDLNSPIYSHLDNDFNNRISSKMLFLDYDVATKLNFFTDDGVYRLPNSITHEGPVNSLLFSNNEPNWYDYYSDGLSIF